VARRGDETYLHHGPSRAGDDQVVSVRRGEPVLQDDGEDGLDDVSLERTFWLELDDLVCREGRS
jgi:hypothetical protein